MFEQCFKDLMKHEGGYVNDPKDPGGETKYGISKKAYPNLNISSLNKEMAKDIYYKDYWVKMKVESISGELRPIYFDMAVNMGKNRAVKIMQKAANNKGRKIDVDGGLGPATRKALKDIEHKRVQAFRVKYYSDLVNAKPELEKFYYGWYRRAVSV